MLLKDYVKNKSEKIGMSRKDFAKLLGISYGYLDRLCNQERTPSEEFATKIYQVTDGAVTKEELLAGKTKFRKKASEKIKKQD